jgi:hypothetical protein
MERNAMNCMKARADLLDHLSPRDTGDSAAWLAVSGCIEADDENFSPLITQQIIHVANCQSCQKWLDFIDPSRITAIERAEKYCCAQMQGAVNGDDGTKFSFEMFRNEDPSWCINGDYAFARFCPWCGKELPDRSFE